MIESSFLETLDLYCLSGVDEVVADAPVNRFFADASDFPPPAESPRPIPENPNFFSAAPAAVKAQGLPELKAMLENFDGCGLRKTAQNLVFGTGQAVSPDVMIVGEAPGAEEDRIGEPFVGASGRLLDLMLKSINLSRRESVYITNVVPWRPPANRKPSEDEISACLPFLRCHISLVKPKILLLLGGISLSAVLRVSGGITKSRGIWMTYESDDKTLLPAMASFHPAYLLRTASQKKNAWRDFLCVRAKLNELNG